MSMPRLQGPVGQKGRNAREDVRAVQALLNRSLEFMPGVKGLTVDGIAGPKTDSAIGQFQKRVLSFARPDSRVDPRGKTLEQLWLHALAGDLRAKGRFSLEIRRNHCSTRSITGDLIIGNETICRTLELPWNWNRKSASCIPFGEYGGSIRNDGARGWRIQLTGVPGRSLVQIHVGNYPHQIEGCILVGTRLGNDAVFNSRDALKLLHTLFTKANKPSIGVRITGVMRLPAEMVPPGSMRA